MDLWRISRYADLRGVGGLRASGRWHAAGQPVVYLSESPAGALLEVCVHTAANDVPPLFTLLHVEGPDVDVPSVGLADLPEGWQEQPAVTRSLGTRWLRERASLLLRVPSAIVPATANVLFNPMHADAGLFRIAAVFESPFDGRIKR